MLKTRALSAGGPHQYHGVLCIYHCFYILDDGWRFTLTQREDIPFPCSQILFTECGITIR